MPKKIPVAAAREIANKFVCRQVILLAWDGELTHIVTYGKSVDDCAHAAAGGNMLKQKWGWPECNDQPSRVRKLEEALKELIAATEFEGADSQRFFEARNRGLGLIAKAEGK